MKFDIGCYGDGTHGHGYTRARCADTMMGILEGHITLDAECRAKGRAIVADLLCIPSHDCEEERDACDWLQEHANIPRDSYWDWQDGDFGLWLSEDM